MKKLLQTLAIALPLLGFSQLFKFNTDGDAENWQPKNADLQASVVSGGNFNVVRNTTSNNPYIQYTSTIDATTKKYVRVNLRNLSGFDRLNFRSDGSTATTANIGPFALPTYETTSGIFKDYYIDLNTTANFTDWSANNETLFQLRFATTLTPVAGEKIEINEIEFLDNLNKHTYNFDYAEQWTPVDGTLSTAGGILTLTPTAAAPKIVQNVLTVDASANKYIHILYKNNSALNNQLRLQYKHAGDGYANFKGANLTVATSMSNFQEVIFDMSTAAEWTGVVKNLQLIIKEATAPIARSTTANATDGTLEIDQIVINNSSSTLGVNDGNVTKKVLSVYPNPVSDVLNINAASKISSAKVFNMAGQVVKTFNSTKQINVSGLAKGNYVVKVKLEDGTESVSKFIKK